MPVYRNTDKEPYNSSVNPEVEEWAKSKGLKVELLNIDKLNNKEPAESSRFAKVIHSLLKMGISLSFFYVILSNNSFLFSQFFNSQKESN